MKVTLNWLKQYVQFDWSADELAERLTMLGIEVEAMQRLGGEFEGTVVAQVAACQKHPNADKLLLCRVNDGQTERQIVCGAHNFKVGDKVALILPGHSLPSRSGEPLLTIKIGKIRGVESQGMMCSPQELGLEDKIDGLLILREDAKVGQPFAQYLGRPASEVVYDLEITPNRPDLNSVIGIAREISAVTGNPLKLSELRPQPSGSSVDSMVAVRIEDADLCPRYTARLVRGVKVGLSPGWLKQALENIGIRSINNVVDVTNYVMMEIGQPLHAFDYHLLAKRGPGPEDRPTIVVRRAAEGEMFTTLDGQERRLTDRMLLIADETKAMALAGIMGGLNSEISLHTVDVLLESAYFKPQNIRATSKKLDLQTESSYRFERGGDPAICDWASQRAAQLIVETAGGLLAEGVIDAYPKSIEPRQIKLRHRKVNELLGIELPPEQIESHLTRLGLKPARGKPAAVSSAESPTSVTFEAPTFRVDLKREVDLIEEVVRLYGVEKIPATPPRGAVGVNPYDAFYDQLAEVRRLLTSLGVFEAQGQTLIGETAACLIPDNTPRLLANPLSSDMNVLRPSLLPGLLDSLKHNISRKNYEVTLFEIGRVFHGPLEHVASPRSSASQPDNTLIESCRESWRLAIALTGHRNPLFWTGDAREAAFDLYDLKGLLEVFFDQFGARGIRYTGQPQSTTLFLESATIQLGKFQLGQFGQLLPTLAKQYDLRDAVLMAELDLDVLLARRNPEKSFQPLPAFPSVRRDVAMIVPETTTHESVLHVVKQAKPANLEMVDLFDVFRGKNVPKGQKSMAYAFTYRHPERTLTDAEVNATHAKLVSQFKQHLNAVVRE